MGGTRHPSQSHAFACCAVWKRLLLIRHLTIHPPVNPPIKARYWTARQCQAWLHCRGRRDWLSTVVPGRLESLSER